MTEIVEGVIDDAQRRFDGAGMVAARWRSVRWCGEDRTEQPSADLDQQRAEAHAVSSEAITPAGADALGETMGAEFAEVIA